MIQRKQILPFLSALLLIGLLSTAVLLPRRTGDHQMPALPSEKEINNMVARFDASSLGLQEVPAFAVPKRHRAALLRLFQPTESAELPEGVQGIGFLEITLVDGGKINLQVFWYGASPLMFRVEGIPGIRGGAYEPVDGKQRYLDEGITFYGVIQEMHREATQGVESERLQNYLDLLGKSAGEK